MVFLVTHEMRPIACCTIILKIISEILDATLSGILDRIMNKNKFGFVKWRYIGDNILMAKELVSGHHIDTEDPCYAIKIGIFPFYHREFVIFKKKLKKNLHHFIFSPKSLFNIFYSSTSG